MASLLDILEKVSGPIAGAVTGLAGSLLGLKARMERVEKKVARHGSALEGHATLIANLDEEMTEKFARLHKDLSDYQQRQSDFASNIRDSNMDFAKDAELGNFMSEQQERWEQIQRTLGQIEGYLGLQNHPQQNIPRPQLRLSNQRTPPPIPTRRK